MWKHVAAAAAGLAATAVALGLGSDGEAQARTYRSARGGIAAGASSPWCPTRRSRSYYGRPVIKEPVWRSPDVPGYLFLGGLAGASRSWPTGARAVRLPRLARVAKVGALGAIGLSALALVHDLGRPGVS